MLSKALLVIGALGIIWLATGLVIVVRSRTLRTLRVNLPKLALCVAIILLAFLASIAANSNGW